MEEREIYKGLAGVPVDYTRRLQEWILRATRCSTCGYPVQDLAATKSVEEVAWLLLVRRAPYARAARRPRRDRAERPGSRAERAPRHRRPPDDEPPHGRRPHRRQRHRGERTPMPRTTIPSRTCARPSTCSRRSRRSWRTTSAAATACRSIEPRDDLDYPQNFLYNDVRRGGRPRGGRRFPGEHGASTPSTRSNASTFTARVIASTLSDLHSSVVGAIGALKGPLHGGSERGRHGDLRPDRHARQGRGMARRRARSQGPRSWASATGSTRTAIPACPTHARRHGTDARPLRPARPPGDVRAHGEGDGRAARTSSPTSTTRPARPTT